MVDQVNRPHAVSVVLKDANGKIVDDAHASSTNTSWSYRGIGVSIQRIENAVLLGVNAHGFLLENVTLTALVPSMSMKIASSNSTADLSFELDLEKREVQAECKYCVHAGDEWNCSSTRARIISW